MVPGMEHCTNGVGPNKFDTITALENWIEHGVAPDGIIATKYDGDIIGSTVLRTMPLCKYPEQAHYNGTGDQTKAPNWSCSPLDRSLLDVGLNGIRITGMVVTHCRQTHCRPAKRAGSHDLRGGSRYQSAVLR